jgi:hypothetical protein
MLSPGQALGPSLERGNPKARKDCGAHLAASLCASAYKDAVYRRMIGAVCYAGADVLGVERTCDLIVEQLFGLDDAP